MDRKLEFRGCALSYQVIGKGSPVVFIQGVGVHGGGWRPQIDVLATNYCCLSFDNRGVGKSQPVAFPLTVEQMADDTLAIMDAAGLGSAHIVGHSLGGIVAQQLALTVRDRVRSLSLLCTSARGADATRMTAEKVWLGLRFLMGTRRMRRLAFLNIILDKDYLAAHDADQLAASLSPIFGHDLADTPPVTIQQLGALKRYDSTDRLTELRGIPTLVIAAEYDIIFPPRFGKSLADGIPTARYIQIDGAGHGATIQCAKVVNQALLKHFAAAEMKRTKHPI